MARRLFLVLSALAPAVAAATTVAVWSRAELLRRSDVVVLGKVLAQRATATEGPRSIVTRTRVQVVAALKGKAGPEVEVLQVGGTLGPYTLALHGAARMEVGEEVVLFLRCPEKACAVAGLAQGKYGIRADPATGRRRALRDVADLKTKEGAPLDDGPVDLDSLLADIRRLAK